jgi:hypothetical protein
LGTTEVAHLYGCLERLETKLATTSQFWNIQDSASGKLISRATLKDGTSIWRLCPTHSHCIALVVEQDGDLLVWDVCNRAEIETVENHLIDCR